MFPSFALLLVPKVFIDFLVRQANLSCQLMHFLSRPFPAHVLLIKLFEYISLLFGFCFELYSLFSIFRWLLYQFLIHCHSSLLATIAAIFYLPTLLTDWFLENLFSFGVRLFKLARFVSLNTRLAFITTIVTPAFHFAIEIMAWMLFTISFLISIARIIRAIITLVQIRIVQPKIKMVLMLWLITHLLFFLPHKELDIFLNAFFHEAGQFYAIASTSLDAFITDQLNKLLRERIIQLISHMWMVNMLFHPMWKTRIRIFTLDWMVAYILLHEVILDVSVLLLIFKLNFLFIRVVYKRLANITVYKHDFWNLSICLVIELHFTLECSILVRFILFYIHFFNIL